LPDADAPGRAGIPPRFARPLALAAKRELPPNVALMHILIEAAITDGAGEFHFLRGREAYKYEWGAVDRWNRRRSFRRAAAERSVA